MGTSSASHRTYGSVQWAVLPGSAVRGGLIGLLYVPLAFLAFAIVGMQVEEGSEQAATLVAFWETVGPVGIGLAGFVVPIVTSLVLAYVGHGRRRFELGEAGITRTRAMPFRSDRSIPYEDVGGVSLTQSRMQSLYNTGTIVLTDVTVGDEADGRTTRFRYVEEPEAAYTNLLRHLADVRGASPSDLEPPEVGELPSESTVSSRLSGDRRAAGTGFRYLMPLSILHPNPWEAAKHGAVRSLFHAPVVGVLAYLIGPRLLARASIEVPASGNDFAWAAVASYAVFLGGLYYWRIDREQYELYEDHVRLLDGDETATVALEEIDDVSIRAGAVQDNDVGNLALLDADGGELLLFRYIRDPRDVQATLQEWIETATTGTGGSESVADDGETGADDAEDGSEAVDAIGSKRAPDATESDADTDESEQWIDSSESDLGLDSTE